MKLTPDNPAEPFPHLGPPPEEVFQPETEAECVEMIRAAGKAGLAIVPCGGGTSIYQGNRLRANRWCVISTERLAGKIEFSPADMVVTCAAGTTLTTLQEHLRAANQFLPIDHPFADRATMGGIVAANSQGLLRGSFGLPRDRLLGVRAVLADGSVVKGGGKVVKNVAGYDLNKLFAGSWGTLGLITEVTFKTNPQSDSTRHLNFYAPSAERASEAALAVYTSRLEPVYLAVSTRGAPVLSVGLMGSGETVDWQAERIGSVLKQLGLNEAGEDPDADGLRALVEAGDAAARFAVRPTDLPAVIRGLDALPGTVLRAQMNVGVLDVRIADSANAKSVIYALNALMPPGGYLTWTRLPESWRPMIDDVWGRPRGDFHLMRSIKQALDPDSRFSPGRFIGGL